jgi:serine/threonine protein kinase
VTVVPPNQAALAPGDKLGKYEVLRQLAQGGMAEIYLARATGIAGFEKIVVLKRIIPRFARNPEFVQMFLDEARLTATFSHPNVVQVHDVGQQGQSYFFTMEHLHGRDLTSVLERCAEQKRGLTLALALQIVTSVAAGLHYAHDKKGKDGQPLGTVHRDISPNNVMITFDGQVKIVDFGIAKAQVRQSKTKTGTIKGTISYMSPEQAQGLELDRRSDVFSLGVLLYELSTGTRPFRAANEVAVIFKLVNEGAPAPTTRRPNYPPELERIVMKALARDKDERYATAEDLRRDLEQFARAEDKLAPPSALAELMRDLFGDRESIDAIPALPPAERTPLGPALPHTAEPTSSLVVPIERSRTLLGVALAAVLVGAVGGWALFFRAPAPPAGASAALAPTSAPAAPVLAPSTAPEAEPSAAPEPPPSASAVASALPSARPVPARVTPHPSVTAKSAKSAAPTWNLDSPLPP